MLTNANSSKQISCLYCLYLQRAMAASITSSLRMGDMLECPICKDELREPRVLPCIHTFCLVCLQQYGKDDDPGDDKTCPVCRQMFVIPSPGGFVALPQNEFIKNQLLLKHMSDTKRIVPCEICP